MSACARAPYNPLLGPACLGFRPTAYQRGNLGPVKSGIDASRRGTFRIYLRTAAMRARAQPQSLLLLRALKHSPARDLNLVMMQSTQGKGPRAWTCTPAQAGAEPELSKMKPGPRSRC